MVVTFNRYMPHENGEVEEAIYMIETWEIREESKEAGGVC